jgi:FkbM family methyltransferase
VIQIPFHLIDAGANIGFFSVYFNYRFNTRDLFVKGIEPDHENCGLLKKKFKVHKFSFDIFKGALWPENTMLELQKEFRDGESWSLAVRKSDRNGTIPTITLGDVLKERRTEAVTILKLDVEGSEKDIIFSENFVRNARKIDFICIEVHTEIVSTEKILEQLEILGFSSFADKNLVYAKRLKI